MEARAGEIAVHYVEHGVGRPVLVLHGAGVDHREPEACFEPVFAGVAGFRRIYPDLPGMGRTVAPDGLRSAEDVLDTLLDFAEEVTDGTAYLLIGHSAGGYYAQAMAARLPGQVAGLALVCPLLPGVRDVPEHRVVFGSGEIGDDDFRSYFVVQSPEMLERHERYVAPAAVLVDQGALERIGERWELAPEHRPAYAGPTLVVAGGWTRQWGTPPPQTSLTTTRTPRSRWPKTRATHSPTSSPTCCARSSPTGSRASSDPAEAAQARCRTSWAC